MDLTPFSSLLSQLRQLNPGKANDSDESLLWEAAQNAENQGVIAQFPELAQFQRDARKEVTSPWEEAKGSLGSGVDQFQSKLYDTAALAGDVVGSDALKEWGEEGRDRNQEEASKFAPIVGSLEQVKTPSDFGYWLTNLVASQAPQLAGTVAASAAAAALAPEAAVGAGATGLVGLGVRGLAALGMGAGEKAAAGLSVKALAGFIGASASGFTQMQNYGELKQQGGKDVIPLAIANGLIGSALEAYGPASMLARLTKQGVKKEIGATVAKGILDRVPAPIMSAALHAAKEGSTEMLTEMAQEATSIATEIVSNRDNPDFKLDDEQVVSRLVNNGVAGFVLGGGLGALSGYAESRHTPTQTTSKIQAMEQAPAAPLASLDAAIPSLPAAQPAAQPAEVAQSVSSAAPTASADAVQLATPDVAQRLIELGVPAEQAPTIPLQDALVFIQETERNQQAAIAQRPAAVQPPVDNNAQIAQQMAEQRAAQDAADRARVQAEAQQSLADAQPDYAQPQPQQPAPSQPAPPAAPVTAKIIPFPIQAQPGESQLASRPEGEPTPVRPQQLSPTEIRRRANLQRIEGSNIVDVDFNTGDVLPIRKIPAPVAFTPDTARVIEGTAPTPLPESQRGAVSAPNPEFRDEASAAQAPVVSTPPVESIPLKSVAVVTSPNDPILTKRSKLAIESPGTTRNVAYVARPDGSVLAVPVTPGRNGPVMAKLREKSFSSKEIYSNIAQSEGLSAMAVEKIVRGERGQGGRHADRNARIIRRATALGYGQGDALVPLAKFVSEQSGRVVSMTQHAEPVPAGVREFAKTSAEFEQKIAAMRAAAGVNFEEGAVFDTGAKGTVSLNAIEGSVPDSSAANPAEAAMLAEEQPAIVAPAPTERAPAVVTSAPAEQLPVEERVAFTPVQVRKLAKIMFEDGGEMFTGDNTASLVRLLTPEQKSAFAQLSPDERKSALRDAMQQAIDYHSKKLLRRVQPDDYRASDSRVEHTFNTVLRAAARMGIDVSVFQTSESAANKFFHEEGGAYVPSKRAVLLSVNDALNPSRQNLITALHEVVHDVVRQEPAWVQKAMHDMIERMPLGETAFYKNAEADPRVQQGGPLTNEKLVEHLTLRGLEKNYATGLVAQLWRAVTHVLTKTALYLQTKFLGAENTSGKLAQAYAENRVAQVLGGDFDSGVAFLSQFGRKPEMGTFRHLLFANGEQQLDRFTDGKRVYPFATDFSVGAAVYNITSPFASLKETAQLDGLTDNLAASSELAATLGVPEAELRQQPQQELQARFDATREKATSNTRIEVAVANQLDRLYARLFEQVKAENAEATAEQFFADHRVTNPLQVKQEAIASLRGQLELELGETLGQLPFDENILIDALPQNERALATHKLAIAVSQQVSRATTQFQNAREQANTLEQRIKRNADAVSQIDRQLTDVMVTDRIARDYLRGYLADLSKDLKRTDKTSVAWGEVNATLHELENRSNEELSTDFTDKVLKSIGVEELSLPAVFKALFARERNGDFDLSADKPSQIRDSIREFVLANPDSPLSALVELGEGPGAKSRGTALLAAVLTLAKDQAHIVDTIRLQMNETTDGRAQLLRLREVLNETNETKLAEALDKAKNDLKAPGSKTIFSWLKRREKALAEKKALARAEEKARWLQPSVTALRDTLARIDQRLGIGHNLNIVPGEKLMVPPSPDASSDQVKSSLVEITMGRDRWLKSEQVRDILKAQSAWLEARAGKPELHDEIYNTINRNYQKVLMLLSSDSIHTTLGKLASGKHVSLMEELRRTNTRAGEAAARNIMEFGRIERSNGRDAIELGKRWEVAAEKFYAAAKLSAEQAKEIIYDPAFFFLGDMPGLTEDEAFVKLRALFSESPATANIADNENSWRLFVDWIKTTKSANRSFLEIAHSNGLYVRDEKLVRNNVASGRDEAAFRPTLEQGVTGYTLPQRIHGHVGAVISRFSELLKLRGDANDNPFHDVALKMQMDPAAVGASLSRLFGQDPEFKTRVVEPLLTDTSRTHVPMPDRGDGRSLYVPPADASRAWAAANGDVLEYARQLYLQHGVDGRGEGLRNYQTAIVQFLAGRIGDLDRQINPTEKPYAGLQGLSHYAMDARVASNFPRSWLTYDQFSSEDNRHKLHTIAANAAFGRNFERQDSLYGEIQQELENRSNDLNVADREALKKEAGKDWFALREDAEKKIGRASTFKQLTRDIMNPDTGATDDLGPLMEVYSTVLSGMVFGLRGALKNLLSVMDTLTVERSLTTKSLGTVAKGYASTARATLSAIAGIFGPDLLKYSRNYRLIDEAGGFDVAQNVPTSYWMKGTRGVNNNFDKRAGGKVQRFTRQVRNLVNNAHLGFGRGNIGPQLRPNLFSFFQIASNYGITDALLSRFDELANLGADYYAKTGSVSGKFSAKDIGYSDHAGLESLRDEAQNAGFTLEEIAEKALRRRDKGTEIFDKDTVQKVMNLTLTRIAGESGAASRPAYMLTSKFARANSALVGWSFFKSAQVARLLRDPEGRKSLMTVANGAKVMALGLVPMAVAFSMLLDEYDDKLTGKRANLLPVDGNNMWSAILERSVNMGSFGIAGNVPDTIMNIKDGTGRWGLSVDQGIVWLNSAATMVKTLSAAYHMGPDNLNYANFYRPMAQSVGLGGVLQYVQIADHLFPEATRGLPVFEQEAGVTARTNAGNILRAAGREMGLELRAMGGSGTPTETTPWITDMTIAAMRDDREAFQKAYEGAVKAAMEAGKPDPVKYVKSAFQSRHPLRSIFRTTPSQEEYQQLLTALDPNGRGAVESAVALANTYGLPLGVEPFYGSPGEGAVMLAKLLKSAGRKPSARVSTKVSVNQMKAMLAARRMGEVDDN